MSKSLLYRFFGVGRMPQTYRAAIEREGVILSDEGVKGSITHRNFRSPHRIANWRRQWYTASLAVTELRLVGFRFSRPVIDVPFADERVREMQFSLENENTLLVAFDASLFQTDSSGAIEYRYKTPLAQAFLDKLRERVN